MSHNSWMKLYSLFLLFVRYNAQKLVIDFFHIVFLSNHSNWIRCCCLLENNNSNKIVTKITVILNQIQLVVIYCKSVSSKLPISWILFDMRCFNGRHTFTYSFENAYIKALIYHFICISMAKNYNGNKVILNLPTILPLK